jgi:hypothetical protein
MSFLAITLVPAISVTWIPPEDRVWPSALLEYFWILLLGPTIQLLGLAALIAQARKLKHSHTDTALSVQGLVLQAVVFFLVGLSFLFRFKIPAEEWDEHFIVNLRMWYWRWGWATINNLVFALAQGVLALIASRRRDDGDGERTALLSA